MHVLDMTFTVFLTAMLAVVNISLIKFNSLT